MENKNELSDIVLEKDHNKTLKTKRILIIIALLIIVFLGVLVTMKIVNKPVNNNAPKLILPPEPKAESVKKDEELFKQVPIIEENKTKKDNFDNVVKNLKEKEMKKAAATEQNATKPQVKTEQNPVSTVVEPLHKEPAKVVSKATSKKKAPAKTVTKDKGVYIQVGATAKAPSANFLKLIKSKKLNYKLYTTTVKGKKVTKILVGPYKTRQDAKDHLNEVRTAVSKNAFIYRIR